MRTFCLFFSLLIGVSCFGAQRLEVPKILASRASTGGGGGSSVAFVQSSNKIDSVGLSYTTTNCHFSANVTAGNAIVVCLFWKNSQTVSSVTDNLGNTYSDCGAGRIARPTDGFAQILGAKNITGGSCTVTSTWSGSVTEADMIVMEYSGCSTSSLFDSVSGSGTASSGTTLTTGSFTPTATSGAIIGFANSNGAQTALAGSGFTSRFSDPLNDCIAEDKVFTSAPGSSTASANMVDTMTKGVIVGAVIKAP